MKEFRILCLLFLSTWTLTSCFFSEDDIFNTSSSERTEQAVEDYKKLLTSSPAGWLLEYYAGGELHDIGGVTMLMRFEGEKVDIISNKAVQGYTNPEETPAGQIVTSTYSLKSDQGPVLSFDTYNVLLHYWSEPKGGLDVDGFQGDFEFIITGTTENSILLKGKKYGVAMKMTRLPEGTDWHTYIDNCLRIYEESGEYGTLVGYNGSNKFAPSAFSQENVITFTENNGNSPINRQKVSFAYTDKGLRLYSPTTVNGIVCDEFIWHNDTKTFTSATDDNIKLQYERPADYVPIEFYTDNEWACDYVYNSGMNDTTENISFTRVGDTDTLQFQLSDPSRLKYTINAIYNPTTGMIEVRTQYLAKVQLIISEDDPRPIDAYIHLCPWNEFESTMYLVEKAGIVSYTSQTDPRVFEFTDNGRVSGSELNGFVFCAFTGPDRTSGQLGLLNTYNEIKIRQIKE